MIVEVYIGGLRSPMIEKLQKQSHASPFCLLLVCNLCGTYSCLDRGHSDASSVDMLDFLFAGYRILRQARYNLTILNMDATRRAVR